MAVAQVAGKLHLLVTEIVNVSRGKAAADTLLLAVDVAHGNEQLFTKNCTLSHCRIDTVLPVEPDWESVDLCVYSLSVSATGVFQVTGYEVSGRKLLGKAKIELDPLRARGANGGPMDQWVELQSTGLLGMGNFLGNSTVLRVHLNIWHEGKLDRSSPLPPQNRDPSPLPPPRASPLPFLAPPSTAFSSVPPSTASSLRSVSSPPSPTTLRRPSPSVSSSPVPIPSRSISSPPSAFFAKNSPKNSPARSVSSPPAAFNAKNSPARSTPFTPYTYRQYIGSPIPFDDESMPADSPRDVSTPTTPLPVTPLPVSPAPVTSSQSPSRPKPSGSSPRSNGLMAQYGSNLSPRSAALMARNTPPSAHNVFPSRPPRLPLEAGKSVPSHYAIVGQAYMQSQSSDPPSPSGPLVPRASKLGPSPFDIANLSKKLSRLVV